jgi:hypothetical protein
MKPRQIFRFIEVRPNFKDDPKTVNTTVVKEIVSQGANYARLIMAAWPSQLYVLCVFVYGHKFCLGWYDREGVILSNTMISTTILTSSSMQSFSSPPIWSPISSDMTGRLAYLKDIRTTRSNIFPTKLGWVPMAIHI